MAISSAVFPVFFFSLHGLGHFFFENDHVSGHEENFGSRNEPKNAPVGDFGWRLAKITPPPAQSTGGQVSTLGGFQDHQISWTIFGRGGHLSPPVVLPDLFCNTFPGERPECNNSITPCPTIRTIHPPVIHTIHTMAAHSVAPGGLPCRWTTPFSSHAFHPIDGFSQGVPSPGRGRLATANPGSPPSRKDGAWRQSGRRFRNCGRRGFVPSPLCSLGGSCCGLSSRMQSPTPHHLHQGRRFGSLTYFSFFYLPRSIFCPPKLTSVSALADYPQNGHQASA